MGTIPGTNLVEKALLETESSTKLGAEFFKKDAEVLAGLGELKTPELTERITEHLVNEGRPGSAEYMGMFSKSVILDKELSLLEAGMYDKDRIEQAGLPLMIDVQQTTTEMLEAGQAVLSIETREDFVGAANTLKYKLDQHIGKSTQKAADYYSTEFTREKGITERLQGMLGITPEPYEIPFLPTEDELAKLNEMASLRYLTREEAKQTFLKELQHMMKQRPRMIGLEGTASFSKFMGEISQELGGDTTSSINIERLRNAHNLMTGRGAMEELQIYPEFGEAIKNGVDRDLSGLNKTTESEAKTTAVEGEVVFHNGEWIAEDINTETKEWLNEKGYENFSAEYTQEENERAKLYGARINEQATKEAKENPGAADVLKEIFDGEGDMSEEVQEASKLLLRIAVKASVALAVIIARNIAKDKDTPPEVKVMLGVFADGLSKVGDFADKAIAGNEKANLERDILHFINDKHN